MLNVESSSASCDAGAHESTADPSPGRGSGQGVRVPSEHDRRVRAGWVELVWACCLSVCFGLTARSAEASSWWVVPADTLQLVVTTQLPQDGANAQPVRLILAVPEKAWQSTSGSWTVEVGGKRLNGPVQLTELGLVSEQILGAAVGQPPAGTRWREAHWVLPAIAEPAALHVQLELLAETGKTNAAPATAPEQFHWHHEAALWTELKFGNRGVFRYMHEPLDESTAERRGETYKVYHHVYDPRGERFVTKGPGGLFPHHRGLFYGFNKITYGDQQADTWHCNHGEELLHQASLREEGGVVLGRHRVLVSWIGQDEKPFAEEVREMAAYHVPNGQMIEFASRLIPLVPAVQLDGDPQHAGFQFRASQEVPDQTKERTYYVRPDGPGKPGQFRNWPDQPEHVNLAWHALVFVLGEQTYTCCYFDRPQNPKPARFSERDYGRFGSYFSYRLTAAEPLVVNYRVWLQEQAMDPQQIGNMSRAFVEPLAWSLEK